jgi:hypothetical protein
LKTAGESGMLLIAQPSNIGGLRYALPTLQDLMNLNTAR